MTYDQSDLNNLALVSWKEARGEGQDGMRAVMHVIVNRVAAPDFPKSVHNVIYQKNAFSSMTVPSDLEFNLQPQEGDAQYDYCLQIAPRVLSEIDPDNTNGAVWYANEAHVTSGWYKNNIMQPDHPVTVVIGKQTFRK